MEENIIVYVPREGYEIKTWIYAEDGETHEEMERKARDVFKQLGVEIFENDSFEFDEF